MPVVASETRIDRYYFGDDLVRFFPSGDPRALAAAVVEVLEDVEGTRRRVERALAYARAESWEVKKHDYLALVHRLCGRSDPHRGDIHSPDRTFQAAEQADKTLTSGRQP
ncbi:MAG: hypothetical protein KatS3mg132_023 [Limisphaera sp.]|nr:MAG: hypothetical protein KatS3mg132_023 [Limisphaera sp.]